MIICVCGGAFRTTFRASLVRCAAQVIAATFASVFTSSHHSAQGLWPEHDQGNRRCKHQRVQHEWPKDNTIWHQLRSPRWLSQPRGRVLHFDELVVNTVTINALQRPATLHKRALILKPRIRGLWIRPARGDELADILPPVSEAGPSLNSDFILILQRSGDGLRRCIQ